MGMNDLEITIRSMREDIDGDVCAGACGASGLALRPRGDLPLLGVGRVGDDSRVTPVDREPGEMTKWLTPIARIQSEGLSRRTVWTPAARMPLSISL